MDSSFFSQQMPYCLLTLLVYMALVVTLSLCPIFSVDNTSPYLLSPPISALASVDAILYLFIFANDEKSCFSINPNTQWYTKIQKVKLNCSKSF